MNFQQIIFALNQFWADNGCVILQPYDMEVGAGTFHPATFLAAIGPEPSRSAYVQPSRRPTDGRYGENPNRLQHYFQYQVVLKPSPANFQNIYLDSIRSLGLDPTQDDIRFVEDDWESPTLGAWGLGWEVWLNGMEITQFTYFQQVGGLECRPVTGEITYGLERIAMYVQEVDNVFDLDWNGEWSYGDLYAQNEVEQSAYNFEHANTDALLRHFDTLESQCRELTDSNLSLPAYERVLQASHTFNLLDARRVISVTERARYIGRVRNMARSVAQAYYGSREQKHFPRLWPQDCSESSAEDIQPPSNTPENATRSTESKTETLLLEIGTEELPPDSVTSLQTSLHKELRHELMQTRLIESSDASEPFGWATPRRIAVQIRNVRIKAPDTQSVRTGPPVTRAYNADGTHTKAAKGFAGSCGVDVDSLERVANERGEFLAYRSTEIGLFASELIPECVERAISRLPIPKRMRWGQGEAEFIRPVHWVVLMLGSAVIPCKILFVESGQSTKGHRFLSKSSSLTIDHALAYEQTLAGGCVHVQQQRRHDLIETQIKELQQQVGGEADFNPHSDFNAGPLLEQVVNLVEYPCSFRGSFDPAFLELPKEVLVASMQGHQKFFPLWNGQELLPYFIAVANIADITATEPKVSERVVVGNERVLRARLSDARFFWNQDRKTRLEDRTSQLRDLVFHKSLGSLFDKTMRIGKIAKTICQLPELRHASVDACVRASMLCKSDLVTEMVGEFPHLQGIMGCHYAMQDGESNEIAKAIEEHYLPRTAIAQKMPQSSAGLVVALADRLDSLVGLIAAGETAGGDRDPYALRRMATGILRLLIENKINADLRDLLRACADIYASDPPNGDLAADQFGDATVEAVFDLIFDRLDFHYVGRDRYAADEFAAVFATKPARLYDFDRRIEAVKDFKKLAQCSDLIAANKRIRNILRNADESIDGTVKREMLADSAESLLHERAADLKQRVAPLIDDLNHTEVLRELAVLKEPIDQFFDNVMVMDQDASIRDNRMNLAMFVSRLFLAVADVSLLHPPRVSS